MSSSAESEKPRTPRHISLADVRASFNAAIRDQATVMYFGRPLANRVTPFFFNRGWSGNDVTYLCIALSFAGLALLLWNNPVSYVGAAAIFYLVFVLDCADGNLARLSDSVSYYGKFIDGLSDAVFVFLAPLFAGAGLWLSGAGAWWFAVGALVTVTTITTQMIRNRYSFCREWMVGQSGPLTAEEQLRLAPAIRIERVAAFVFVNSTFVAPLFLIVPITSARGYLIWLALLHPAANVAWIASVIWQASRILRRPRRSIHAA